MLPEIFQKVARFFSSLPGVGPRQAARFAFELLNRPKKELIEVGQMLGTFREELTRCKTCFFLTIKTKNGFCEICNSPTRNQNLICVVEKETDLMNLEKTKAFIGVYHVLGSVILKTREGAAFRLKELIERIRKMVDKDIEIILALNPTTEGDATANYLEQELKKLEFKNLKISHLGRGLATGNELEYADVETIKSALERRL